MPQGAEQRADSGGHKLDKFVHLVMVILFCDIVALLAILVVSDELAADSRAEVARGGALVQLLEVQNSDQAHACDVERYEPDGEGLAEIQIQGPTTLVECCVYDLYQYQNSKRSTKGIKSTDRKNLCGSLCLGSECDTIGKS